MLTAQTVLGFVRAAPFRPFRIHMASGRTYDIRHPEMIKVLKTYVLVFSSVGETFEIPDQSETVSLVLAESISYLETQTA
jgi:hypothetical protein